MRNGEHIPIHLHNTGANAYLTGIIIVKTENTFTNFVHPCNQIRKEKFIEYKSKNKVGKIVFFPSCLPHYVDTYYYKDERIILSFDIISKKRNILNIPNYDKRLMEFIP
jgi:hypothetical protein